MVWRKDRKPFAGDYYQFGEVIGGSKVQLGDCSRLTRRPTGSNLCVIGGLVGHFGRDSSGIKTDPIATTRSYLTPRPLPRPLQNFVQAEALRVCVVKMCQPFKKAFQALSIPFLNLGLKVVSYMACSNDQRTSTCHDRWSLLLTSTGLSRGDPGLLCRADTGHQAKKGSGAISKTKRDRLCKCKSGRVNT